MKTIKFRGKCSETGNWIYGDLMRVGGFSVIYHGSQTDAGFITGGDPRVEIELFSDEVAYVHSDTVGQFTGLTDSDGKEVYDGDIISINGIHPKLIRYMENCASFCMANVDEIGLWYIRPWQNITKGWWEDMRRDIKVIGNGFDNGELIKNEVGQ